MIRPARVLVALALVAALAGCGRNREKVNGGLAPARITQIGVNSYLWRATLDTLSFMTIAQTDSNGGTVITDWYVNPNAPNERMKVSVAILDQELRADAVRVGVSRQLMQNGQWTEAAVQAATVQKLEEIILAKARDLRRTSVSG